MPPLDTDTIRREISTLASDSLAEASQAAAAAGMNLLTTSGEDLRHYAGQLQRGEIDEDDLKDLALDLLALANVEVLLQQGIAKVRVAKFTRSVVDILIAAVIRAAIGAVI